MPATYEINESEHASLMGALTSKNSAKESEAIWRGICQRVGCKPETVGAPPAGKSTRFFTAEPIASNE
jgi:hypothetical protein